MVLSTWSMEGLGRKPRPEMGMVLAFNQKQSYLRLWVFKGSLTWIIANDAVAVLPLRDVAIYGLVENNQHGSKESSQEGIVYYVE